MSNLSAFMADNAIVEDNVKFPASKRFVDKNGEPIEWEIKAIASDEDEAIRKACTRRVPISGKRGRFTQETDFNLYLGKLAAVCTVYPNLNDAELQNSYGVMGADVLLKKMLRPGEYTEYLAKVQEVNSFDISMDELVDEAKN